MSTIKDAPQAIKASFDDATESLKVSVVASEGGIGLFTEPYDAISVAYPSATQEVYTSKTGGVSGTTVQVITINYTDASKEFITNASRA